MPQDSFADFDFDLTQFVVEELVDAFDDLPVGKLLSRNIRRVDEGRGVYQLFERNEVRYVGKTDNLQHCLARHEMALAGRHGLDPKTIGFKALHIDADWFELTTGQEMIRHFSIYNSLLWNTPGFWQ
jgi:hypothetical protein